MTLYEIDSRIEAIRNRYEIDGDEAIDTETGEISTADALFSELNALEMAREDKIEGVGILIKELTSDVAAIEAEEDSLAKRKKAKKNTVESLKGWLDYALCGKKFETSRVGISSRKTEKVVITDLKLLPDEYVKTKIETSPDKVKIKSAIKLGSDVPGAELETGRSILVK